MVIFAYRFPIRSGKTENDEESREWHRRSRKDGKEEYMAKFKIDSVYRPSGDQPTAIKGICDALNDGVDAVTLLGVTGSGKTFTMANVIEKLQRPALILSHNKTLAAQLYGEFKSFFPNNAVEYFVSYYDYYQPEAYLPVTDTYIEKDLSINDEIEKLRLSAASGYFLASLSACFPSFSFPRRI